MIKKLLIYGLLIFLGYKGLSYYTVYTSSVKLMTCLSRQEIESIKNGAKSQRENLLISTKGWRCVNLKQNFIEKLFFKVPDQWINPSRTFVDPPFTEEELGIEPHAVNVEIKKDLQAFVAILSTDEVKNITALPADINWAEIEQLKHDYEARSASLKNLIGKLRALKPDSIKVFELKTQFAYLLDQLRITNDEEIQLFTSAAQKMAESDVLLLKPKSEIRIHRAELLNLQSDFNLIVVKLQALQAKEGALAKDLVKTVDEIEHLGQLYL